MRLLPLAVVALAAFAAGCLVWGADEGPAPAGPQGPRPLAASLVAQPQACSLCHYAWDVPLQFNGTVEETEAGWRYRLRFAPQAAYNLTDVRVVAVNEGDQTVSSLRFSTPATAVRNQDTDLDLHVPLEASGLHVLLVPDREFARSSITLEVAGSPAEGAGGVRVVTVAPPEGLAAGHHAARVRYEDGNPPSEGVRLFADIAPPGVSIIPRATLEEPAEFVFALPTRPRGFAVQIRPHNEHPTGKWLLPNWADRGEVALFVSEGTPPAARAWSEAEVAAAWAGAAERVLDEERVDGVILRTQDARGEWTRQARWITPPGEESPFPPVPPGTREIRAEVTWSPRTPVSPAPAPFLGWAHHLGPTFYYPQPVEESAGRRLYVLAVDPAWWQGAEETGGFQAFALLPLDAQRSTVFDGSYGLKLTAVRG